MNRQERRNKSKNKTNSSWNKGKLIDGMYYAEIEINNKLEMIPMQVMMALSFVDNPNNYLGVRNIDGNLKNNRADNLEWVDVDLRSKLPPENVAYFDSLPDIIKIAVVQ